jgi:hypothetical protein
MHEAAHFPTLAFVSQMYLNLYPKQHSQSQVEASCARVQSFCAKNRKGEASTRKIAAHVLVCAAPLLLAWVGGLLLVLSAHPFGDSLSSLLAAVVDQARHALARPLAQPRRACTFACPLLPNLACDCHRAAQRESSFEPWQCRCI